MYRLLEEAQGVYLSDNHPVTRYTKSVVQKLLKAGNYEQYPITVKVSKDPIPNASARPSGDLTFTIGVIHLCENEAQLAAVAGHEIGHYIHRHGMEKMLTKNDLGKTKEILINAWEGVKDNIPIALDKDNINAINSFLKDNPFLAKKITDSKLQKQLASIPDVGLIAGFYSNSRNAEYESDTFGFNLAKKAGYDTSELPKAFNNFNKVSSGGEEWSYTRTHPLSSDRYDKLLKMHQDDPVKGYIGKASHNRRRKLLDRYFAR